MPQIPLGKVKNFKAANGLECEDCHTEIKGQAIRCGNCKGVLHLGCTGYSNEQLTVYYVSTFQYICKKCLIEKKGANGLYSEAMRFISSIKASDGKLPTPQITKAPKQSLGRKENSSSNQLTPIYNITHSSSAQTTRRNTAETEPETHQLPTNQLENMPKISKATISRHTQ